MGAFHVAEKGLGALILVTAVPARITGVWQATRGDWGGAASFSGGFILVFQPDIQIHNALNEDFLILPVCVAPYSSYLGTYVFFT